MEARITVTERAARRIREIIAAEKRAAHGLRVEVIGGGPQGLRYRLDFDREQAGDLVVEREGARIIVDLKSLLYLDRAEIDYEEGLTEAGFVVRRPLMAEACGCGTPTPAYAETPSIPEIW